MKGISYRSAFPAPFLAVLLALLLFAPSPSVPLASAQTSPSVSVDAISDGNNTATSVGTVDGCGSVQLGSSFAVDVVIQGVASLSGFQADLLYDPSIVKVTGVNYGFLLTSTSVGVVDIGDTVPDSDGAFLLGAVQFPTLAASGSGVLARITLQAVGVGFSTLNLSMVELADASGNPISPSDSVTHVYLGPVNGAGVVVNGGCPDADGDGVPDGSDNCPNWPNPTQVLPPWLIPANDPDCDRFTTSGETFMGTNSTAACGVNAWPVDNNNDHSVELSDILAYIPVFATTGPGLPYKARYDLNADNTIGLTDILMFIPFFGRTCTP